MVSVCGAHVQETTGATSQRAIHGKESRMWRTAVALTTVVVLTVRVAAHENWCGYDYVMISPVVEGQDPAYLSVNDLNDAGTIVGDVRSEVAFVLDGARFKEYLAVPGVSRVAASKINNRGVIVGRADAMAFRRSPAGEIETLSIPCPSPLYGVDTTASGVNGRGVAVGIWRCLGIYGGFVWDGSNVRILGQPPFYPVSPGSGGGFFPQGINNAGKIVGYVDLGRGEAFQAVSYEDGVFTLFELPEDVRFDDRGRSRQSAFFDINKGGAIVGQYRGHAPSVTPYPEHTVHSFVLLPTGEFVPIDFPWQACAPDPIAQRCTSTFATGINDAGEVTGLALVYMPQVVFPRAATQQLVIGFVARPRVCGEPSAPAAPAPAARGSESRGVQ